MKTTRQKTREEQFFFFLFFIFDRDIRYFPFSSRSGRSSLEIFRPVRISREGGGGKFRKFWFEKDFNYILEKSILYLFYTFWIILEGGGRVFELSGYAINSIKLDRVLCNNR